MKKLKKLYYQDRIKEIMFEGNWIEVPLFYNNNGKSIRFLLESKLEQKKYDLISNVFYDIFYKYGDIIVMAHGDRGINHRNVKEYFKFNSLRRIIKIHYNSKLDPKWVVLKKPYCVAYLSKVLDFKFNKYLKHLYEEERTVELVFLEVRKGVALHFYDDRGFDIVCEDKEFAKYLYDKYQEDIMECNIDFNQE